MADVKYVWLRLEKTCPEAGHYREQDLELLANNIVRWEDGVDLTPVIETLKDLPLGEVRDILGTNVVKVDYGRC